MRTDSKLVKEKRNRNEIFKVIEEITSQKVNINATSMRLTGLVEKVLSLPALKKKFLRTLIRKVTKRKEELPNTQLSGAKKTATSTKIHALFKLYFPHRQPQHLTRETLYLYTSFISFV
uniref:Uncharacterized protein n=1 Tax=Glossina austeni TaxID=7395 RepID=A0A1A9VRP0_GLOAU